MWINYLNKNAFNCFYFEIGRPKEWGRLTASLPQSCWWSHTTVRVREEKWAAVLSLSVEICSSQQQGRKWHCGLKYYSSDCSLLWTASLHRTGGRNQCGAHLKLWVIIVDRWEGMNTSLGASSVCWCVINTSRAGEDTHTGKDNIWIKGVVCNCGESLLIW